MARFLEVSINRRKVNVATPEERMQILKMVADGKISAEEGAKLLAALEPEKRRQEPGEAPGEPGKPRWFRIRVTDLETGKNKVSVNLPLNLVDVGVRMGARFTPEVEGFDLQTIIGQIRSGVQGKIVEVEDADSGERVEIYIE